MKRYVDDINRKTYFDAECVYATVYKTRQKRNSDASYTKCVKDINSLNIPLQDRLIFKYGDDLVIYDKREIEKAIDEGKIIFLATCIPDLCKAIKEIFGNNSMSIFVRSQPHSSKDMEAMQEMRNKGSAYSRWYNISEQTKEQVLKRQKIFKELESAYIDFAKKYADHITRNMFTIFNDEWNTKIKHLIQCDIDETTSKTCKVYNLLNSESEFKDNWRNKPYIVSQIGDNDPLSLRKDFEEYLEEKERTAD